MSKKNTTKYGLLVLQNDEVYMKLFKEKPNLFDEMIYEKINEIMVSTTKFHDFLAKSYKSLSIAMESHFPTFQKKQNKFITNYSPNTKAKKLKNIGM